MKSDLSPQKEKIKEDIAFLIKFLGAPDDLIHIYKIAAELQEITRIFMGRADDSGKSILLRLQADLRKVIDGTLDIRTHFPLSRSSKRRKTLKNYYGSHPLYALFWHRAATHDLTERYRVLIASMLPVLLKMEQAKITDKQYFERAEHLARALRQLGTPEKLEKTALLELPTEVMSPAELSDRLEEIFQRFGLAIGVGKCESLRYVRTSLGWFLTGIWGSGRKSLFHRRFPTSTRSAPRHGAAETEGQSERIALQFSFPDEVPRRLAHYFVRPDKYLAEEEQFDPNTSCDDVPVATTSAIDGIRAAVHFVENRRRSATRHAVYAAQAIELANQFLPVSRSNLSDYETGLLLNALCDQEALEWKGISRKCRQGVAAWAACSLFPGRQPKELKLMVKDTSAISNEQVIVWNKNSSTFCLPVVGPMHGRTGTTADQWFVAVDETLILEAPQFLANLINRLPAQFGTLFPDSYEREFERLLSGINARYRVEMNCARIRRVVVDEINRLAPVDRVLGCYFRGDLPNNFKPAVYSAVPVSRIQSLYQEACYRRFRERGLFADKGCEPELPGLRVDSERHVGSKLVPLRAFVRATVEDLKKRIEGFGSTPMASVAVAHNTYTAYVVLFLVATTGIRPVSRWVAADFDIDHETGFCFISDKDSKRYRNAHLVWLHLMLRMQFKEYATHVVRLRRHLALLRPDQIEKFDARANIPRMSSHQAPNRIRDLETLDESAPTLFLLTEAGHVVKEAAPTHVAEYLGSDWKKRIGALRHFVRSQMLYSACSGEITNAMLGHAERGEAAWARFSTMPPAQWVGRVSEVMDEIIRQLKIEVMQSPLFGKSE